MKNKQKELIEQMTDREIIFHLYATQMVLLTISLFLGMILFDHLSNLFDLFSWNDKHIFTIGGFAGIGVVLLDVVLMKLLPPTYYEDGGINRRIFRNRGIFHIAIISAVVAISEEILFRGIIQTHFGLIISSIIFAIIHFRYLFNWFLFINITALSFFIGYIFLSTGNLLVTIFMHFIIDFLLGLVIKFSKTNDDNNISV